MHTSSLYMSVRQEEAGQTPEVLPAGSFFEGVGMAVKVAEVTRTGGGRLLLGTVQQDLGLKRERCGPILTKREESMGERFLVTQDPLSVN